MQGFDGTLPDAMNHCRTCGGQRTGRIEYDDAEMVVEWLRYEMDGLNHLRIDEVYDADSNGELEDPSATGDAWRVQRVYINGPGQLGQIAKVIVYNYASATTNTVASEDVYYYHYDILGNVSVISDPNGHEADQFEQDAFGNLVSGAWTTRIGGITEQITTKPYDADLGLYYFNARWYDASTATFLSRDPANGGAQVADGHDYTLSHANPTFFVDPDGLRPGPVCREIRIRRIGSTARDQYGHYWINLDSCNESYGWWPKWSKKPGSTGLPIKETIFGAEGILNGNDRVQQKQDLGVNDYQDLHHNDTLGRTLYGKIARGHPGYTCSDAEQCLKKEARSFRGRWRWPSGPNCRTFQRRLLRKCDLEAVEG